MKSFFKTVALVSVFSVSEKFLGFLYRIFLSRTIGAEGVGLYQVALSVFGLFYTVACSGIPVTVSRLMTKYRAENQKTAPIKGVHQDDLQHRQGAKMVDGPVPFKTGHHSKSPFRWEMRYVIVA